MGTLRDVIDVIRDIKDSDSDDLFKFKTGRSLSRKAMEGTVQFPALVTSSLDIETAQIITKALERNYATFVQIVFSMDPNLAPSDGKNGSDYIRKFHQNMNVKSGAFGIGNFILNDNATLVENDKYVILSGVYEGSTARIVASNKEQLIDLMEHVRHDILNHKYTPTFEVKGMKQDTGSVSFGKQSKEPNFSKDLLKDNDVKKSNELVATTLHIRIHMLDKDGKSAADMDFIVGVKATMHIVKSDDMIENMVGVCTNDDGVFNFLRWTTGEISFFKDFLFNINNTKHDVYKASSGSSPWWLALKRRKSLSKITDAVPFTKKRILPNATIVMSADEVELIKSEYGYDLFNPIFVNKIMQSYFLLGFVIVDTSAQIAHFVYDGQNDFQSLTFSALEKVNTSDERKFKDMLKVINRI